MGKSKSYELGFISLLHSPYTPDLDPCDFSQISLGMHNAKKFSSNEEMKRETVATFKAKDKSHYKNGIENLEGRYNHSDAHNRLSFSHIQPFLFFEDDISS